MSQATDELRKRRVAFPDGAVTVAAVADPLLHAARACHAGPVTGYHWSVGTFDGALWRVIEADFAVRPMGTQD